MSSETMHIENLIVNLSTDPYNPVLNFDCAVEYERLNQTASAVSFYLRCAELTNDKDFKKVREKAIQLVYLWDSVNYHPNKYKDPYSIEIWDFSSGS